MLSPELAVVRDVHELGPDAELLAAHADLPRENGADVQLPSDGGEIPLAPPIAERAAPGNDAKARQAGEAARDARRYLVAQVIRIGIVIGVDERQDRERFDASRARPPRVPRRNDRARRRR